MGGGPSLMYAADAIHAFDEFQTEAIRHLALRQSESEP